MWPITDAIYAKTDSFTEAPAHQTILLSPAVSRKPNCTSYYGGRNTQPRANLCSISVYPQLPDKG